ncbi:hypothetical protein SNE40_022751 [Patella caerulea]
MSAGLTAPSITSALIEEDQNTSEEWKEVFWIVAAVNVVGTIIFAIFSKGEIQPWAIRVNDKAIDESNVKGLDVKSDVITNL